MGSVRTSEGAFSLLDSLLQKKMSLHIPASLRTLPVCLGGPGLLANICASDLVSGCWNILSCCPLI